MTKNIIEFKNVTKTYEDSGTTVLKDITFEIEEGKFYTLLGASGSGKSTILNIIAGLLDATSGDILLDGQRINDVPTNKRDVHTIFQSYGHKIYVIIIKVSAQQKIGLVFAVNK